MKTTEENIERVTKRPAKRIQPKSEGLKTEPPISEKDAVKRAEKKSRKK